MFLGNAGTAMRCVFVFLCGGWGVEGGFPSEAAELFLASTGTAMVCLCGFKHMPRERESKSDALVPLGGGVWGLVRPVMAPPLATASALALLLMMPPRAAQRLYALIWLALWLHRTLPAAYPPALADCPTYVAPTLITTHPPTHPHLAAGRSQRRWRRLGAAPLFWTAFSACGSGRSR